MNPERWLEYDNRNFFSPEQSVRRKELERIEELVQNGQATQWDWEDITIRYNASVLADDSLREEYIEKELEVMRIKKPRKKNLIGFRLTGKKRKSQSCQKEMGKKGRIRK